MRIRSMGAWMGLVTVMLVAGAGCKPRAAHRTAVPVAPPAVEETVVIEPGSAAPAVEEAPLNAQAAELSIKKSAQVSILCYHDFTVGRSTNPMVINIEHFRQQLQALRDARLPVISMDQFLAWRRGEKDIPDPSIMLTMDDGWKSVASLAHPVIKEFGFPYTIFLYKNYVNGGGRALTTAEITQLLADGVAVGSHSVSHPYPPEFRRRAKLPPDQYDSWVETEFKDSKGFLESLLGIKVTTFAYPGGYYTPEMAQKGRDTWGYEALFTCNPVRTSWDTPATEIGRFIIFGNDPTDRNFKAATNFGGGTEDLGRQLLGGEIGDDGVPQAPMVVVKPRENETVTDRRPRIEIDLSKLADVDPDSVVMRLPGFGQVPATYNADTHQVIYQPPFILRSPEVSVHLRLRRLGQEKDDVVSWKFFIDQKAHYLLPTGTMAGPDNPSPGTVPPVAN